MDLIKIGTYIAGKRKVLGMTQRQLAEQLGMSDKSVSKWERGVCLPDVSLYSQLCQILGISINEFLAGEDIARENIAQKSEENILGVAKDSKNQQRRLKSFLWVPLAVSLLALAIIGTVLYRAHGPQNYIAPMAQESIETKTAELLSDADSVFLYQYAASKDYTALKIFVSEYRAGTLVKKDPIVLSCNGIDAPEKGMVLIVPDVTHSLVKLILATEDTKFSTEIPILEGAEDPTQYGRSASEIESRTDITYDGEQPLVALIYDAGEMRKFGLSDIMHGNTEPLAENDYVYFFSFEFCK